MAASGHRVKVTTALASRDRYVVDGVYVFPRTVDPDGFLSGADVVVSHLGDPGVAAREAAVRSLPSVRMVHGSDPENLCRLEEHPTALAVFNSHTLAAEVGWCGSQIVAHPPVDLAASRTTPGDRVTLVNLSANKGAGLFWWCARSCRSVKFLGVRGGYGRQVVRRERNARVIPPTDNMRGDVYARTKVLLMPSLTETWGMVGLEAMASGIPVVAHPTPGLRESLGNAATFIDRTNLEAWRAEVLRLTHDATAWADASGRASAHASQFDPAPQLAKFAQAVEALA
jgi:hypothetical protein